MNALLTALAARFAAAVRSLTGDAAVVRAPGGTPAPPATKPGRAELVAEAVLVLLVSMAVRLRAGAGDARIASQVWARSVAERRDGGPGPVAAPLLCAAIAASAPPPGGSVLAAARAVGRAAAGLVDDVALRFADRWVEPGRSQLAAGVFVGSLALSSAGIVVSVVTVAAPEPSLHLRRLATIVNLAEAEPATAAATIPASPSTASPPPPAVEEPTTTAPPAAEAQEAEAVEPAPPAPVTEIRADAPPGARPPTARGGLPIGKGMWIWLEDRADGGDPYAIVARAKAAGLTHIYVRTGTLKGGFIGGPFLDRLLPVAHLHGLRVYGWDFPYLDHPGDDVNRALAAIRHTTPTGHRIDGFSADIETVHEGVNNDVEFVAAYSTWLRANVGPDYPLIATVPNPTPRRVAAGFPYHAIVPSFDAVAPMVYWMNRDPAADVANAVHFFAQWGKPVFPIGQAYDGGPEGGPPGVPGRDAIIRFMQSADASGAVGVSFWSWQHATPEVWDAVRDAGEFRLEVGGPAAEGLNTGMVRAYQAVLTGLGFPVPIDGVWGATTVEAVRAYQSAARLPVTGRIDAATRAFLLAPVAAPVVPDGH